MVNRKHNRTILNLQQIKAYNSLLEILKGRVEKFIMNPERSPIKLKPDEKER